MAVDQSTVRAVWQIGLDFYGNRNSQYGWEIDHIVPIDKGGSDAIGNLRPLQWENNAAKGTGRLQCVVTSNGTTNRKAA